MRRRARHRCRSLQQCAFRAPPPRRPPQGDAAVPPSRRASSGATPCPPPSQGCQLRSACSRPVPPPAPCPRPPCPPQSRAGPSRRKLPRAAAERSTALPLRPQLAGASQPSAVRQAQTCRRHTQLRSWRARPCSARRRGALRTDLPLQPQTGRSTQPRWQRPRASGRSGGGRCRRPRRRGLPAPPASAALLRPLPAPRHAA
mmetsp:Transcript_30542/g.76507  ORF Transcript_30542/g.76507 Transcript_30542/m.76507 type:complete len:201 (+) Transcript_30542:1232-1834(+)